MSQSFQYRGVTYASKSQAAIVMLSHNMTMNDVSKVLGITAQTVFAAKKRAKVNIFNNLRKYETKIKDTLDKYKNLNTSTNNLFKIYSCLNTIPDGRIRRYSKLSNLSKKYI